MAPEHRPARRWRTAWLRRECSCGRWRVCRAPQWTPPDRIPDGDRVPWPGNPGRHWATEPTRELPQRAPFRTLGAEYRSRGGKWLALVVAVTLTVAEAAPWWPR